MCTINSRSELKANCRHKSSLLLDKGWIDYGLVTVLVYDFDYVWCICSVVIISWKVTDIICYETICRMNNDSVTLL